MVKLFTRFCFVLTLFSTLFIQKASASHITGSDISYRCLGGSNYQVVVTIYRDCSGIDASTTISVNVTSANCGSQTVLCARDPQNSGVEVSQLCPTDSSTCEGGLLPGVQLYTFVGTVTITPNCGLYTFSYSECCRNTSNNIVNSQGTGYRVVATLNSDIAPCENAPTFTSLPVPYFCYNQPVNYSHGAVDVDGDSLVYTLIPPLDDLGTNIGYNAGYTYLNPINAPTGFGFDSLSGQMTFVPTLQGVYVVDVLVSEYRNGVLIGTTMRDIQIIIIACNNDAPTINSNLVASSVTGGTLIDYNSIGVCPGQNVSFVIGGRDINGQAITVSSNIGTAIPAAILNTVTVGSPDSVIVTFNWTPTGLDTGIRYFTIQFEDNACPITGLQLFTYDITVLDGIDAGPDKKYCPGGGPIQINVFGGNHFNWYNTSGIVSSNADSSIVFVAPSTLTTYIIRSDLAGTCKTLDTVVVDNVSTFTTSIATPDDTICLHASTSLTVTPSPSSEGPFTYLWSPVAQGIMNADSQSTVVKPDTRTTYHVTVVSNSGCVVKDSLQVVIQGSGPHVNVIPTADYVCPGSSVTLNTFVSALACGPTTDPLDPCLPNSTFALRDLGAGLTTGSGNTTPYMGFWDDGKVQYLYLASELQAMGLASGTITDIGWNVSLKSSTQAYDNFTIKMSCTTLNQLTPNFVTGGFSTVLNPQSYSTTLGWNTHTLDVPYNWDGFSNLIIEICFDDSTYTRYDNVYYTTTSFPGSVLWDNADFTTQSGCTALNTPVIGQNRPNTRFIMCTAPLNNYPFAWTGDDGTTLPDTSAPVVPLYHDVTYWVNVDDGTCNGDTFVSLHVDTAVFITAGSDTVICNNDTLEINAHLLHPATPYCIPTYVLSTIPYSAILPAGATLAGPVGDDVVGAAVTLPFTFKFFCNSFTRYFISTNGFISFGIPPLYTAPGSGCCAGQLLPNTITPNNLIAMLWEDLNTNSGGSIDHFVKGTAPNRVEVIRWKNVSFYSVGGYVNGEIHLFETSNVIEVHISAATTANQTNTLGIENATGSVAYSPAGYNAAGWTVSSPIAFRFTPQSAGNAIVAVQWTPTAGLSDATVLTPRAFPSTNTDYVLAATFTNGCVTYDTISITLGTFPYTLDAVPDSICKGDTAQLIFTGDGISFAWTPDFNLSNDTSQSPFARPDSTTTYFVTSSDTSGCGIRDSLRVVVRTHAPITLGNDRNICPYDSAVLTPTGAPYTSYLWSTGDTTSTKSTALQTTPTGDYSVKVNDGKCFFNSDTITITRLVLSTIYVMPSGDTAVCVGDSIVLSADPGFLSYLWSNGAETQSIGVNTAGDYSYIAIDSNGCIVQSHDTTKVISEHHPVANIIASDDTICAGQTTSLLYVNHVTGIGYYWNPGGAISDSLRVSSAGRYYLIASNNGCNSYDSVDIADTNPPVVDLGEDMNICSCDTSIGLSSNISGRYLWSTADSVQNIFVRQSGTYSVTVTDNNECTAVDAATIDIRCLTVDATVSDPPSSTVFIGHDAILNAGTSYSSTFNYQWTPGTYLSDSTSDQPHVVAPQTTTTYWVMATDMVNGCIASDSVRLIVVPPGIPPMPNAFSPNDDRSNDTYGPYIPDVLKEVYTIAQMRIFNRWGQMVYNGNGYWDGTFKGAPQPASTYLYYITLEGPDQKNPNSIIQYNMTGSFTLLR